MPSCGTPSRADSWRERSSECTGFAPCALASRDEALHAISDRMPPRIFGSTGTCWPCSSATELFETGSEMRRPDAPHIRPPRPPYGPARSRGPLVHRTASSNNHRFKKHRYSRFAHDDRDPHHGDRGRSARARELGVDVGSDPNEEARDGCIAKRSARPTPGDLPGRARRAGAPGRRGTLNRAGNSGDCFV